MLFVSVVPVYFFSRFLESNLLGLAPPINWMDMVASISIVLSEVSGIGLGYVLSTKWVRTKDKAVGVLVLVSAVVLIVYFECCAMVLA